MSGVREADHGLMSDTRLACSRCGANNASTAEWCSQCYARLDTLPADVEDPRAEAAGTEEREFAHPDSTVNYQGRPIYSRWEGGATSFGGAGRIVLTLLVIALGVLFAFNYSPVPFIVWVFIAGPALLREIWKKVPIGYTKPEPGRIVMADDEVDQAS